MEPKHNNEYAPASELPQVTQPPGEAYATEKPSVAAAPEARGNPFSVGGGGISNPVPVSAALPVTPQADDPTVAVPAQPASAATAALAADDADLIEKEWVLKAKALVMQTKHDPYQQNIEINGMKADYIKKRYNKDLKISGA